MDNGAELRQRFSFGAQDAKVGVLLVHGFTGTPFEMRLLGETLHVAHPDWRFVGPQLAGHCEGGGSFIEGTRALAVTRWPDWYASVDRELTELGASCQTIFVCGLSLGGLLTLELARKHRDRIAAIAVMATALELTPVGEKFARLMQSLPLVRNLALPKFAGADVRDPEMKRLNGLAQGKAAMPLAPLYSLVEFGHHVHAHLGEIDRPAFVAHARHDHTIPFSSMDTLVRGLATPRENLETLTLEKSFHCITIDVERDFLFARVDTFLSKHLSRQKM